MHDAIVDITMRIEQDFDVIVQQLQGKNFRLKRDGYLVFNSPFINPGDTSSMVFKFKPLVEGSRIYTIVFSGKIDNVMAMLNNAFECYECNPRMVRYDLIVDNYSIPVFKDIINNDTNWDVLTSNDRIHELTGKREATCLLMDDYIQFMSRDINNFADVNKFIQECHYHSDIFIPELDFNLFNYMDLEAV